MKFFYLAVISIFFVSCSSSSTVETHVNPNNSEVTVVKQTNANVVKQTTADTEVQAAANSDTVQNMAVSKRNAGNWGAKKSGASEVEPIEATPMVYPAPDNSEISSTMKNNVPTEVRTFKSNPVLAKMERIFVDVKNPQIKVYLKNGKVLNVPPGKISNSTIVSADEILAAVGMAPKPAQPKVGEKIEQKEQ